MGEEMLRNRTEILKFLGIGKKRFYKWLRMTPPMPARFDGYAYEAHPMDLMEWRRENIKSGN
jgi:hypothetical protein